MIDIDIDNFDTVMICALVSTSATLSAVQVY